MFSPNAMEEFLISSGLPADHLEPQGSHPETDPFFSSQRLAFIHYGAEIHRNGKLAFLRDYPLALEHMRVCYESKDRGQLWALPEVFGRDGYSGDRRQIA